MKYPIKLYMMCFSVCVICIFQYGYLFVLCWKVEWVTTWLKTLTKVFRIILSSYSKISQNENALIWARFFLINSFFLYVTILYVDQYIVKRFCTIYEKVCSNWVINSMYLVHYLSHVIYSFHVVNNIRGAEYINNIKSTLGGINF